MLLFAFTNLFVELVAYSSVIRGCCRLQCPKVILSRNNSDSYLFFDLYRRVCVYFLIPKHFRLYIVNERLLVDRFRSKQVVFSSFNMFQ